MAEHERSPSGSPIHRHKARSMPFQPTSGDGSVIDAVDNHIAAHLGPVQRVFHEIVSDLVHLDVHVVAPREDRPFYTLVTSGMSEAPMTTPPDARVFRFAELMICLPATWPLGLDEPDPEKSPLKDERNYWPIRLLKATARMPHEYDTWLSYGHTVSHGNPPAPYAGNTTMNAVVLLPSMNVPEPFWTLDVNEERQTYFWSLYPLYPEEVAFKLRRGADALWDKLANAGVTDLLDPGRKNVCRKRFFGLF